MTEEAETPSVEMSAATAAALLKRGGHLYVWPVGQGLPTARTKPPDEELTYTTVSSDEGWSVHIDAAIVGSDAWFIKWTRLPWPHFRATYGPHGTGAYRPGWSDVVGAITEAIWWW